MLICSGPAVITHCVPGSALPEPTNPALISRADKHCRRFTSRSEEVAVAWPLESLKAPNRLSISSG